MLIPMKEGLSVTASLNFVVVPSDSSFAVAVVAMSGPQQVTSLAQLPDAGFSHDAARNRGVYREKLQQRLAAFALRQYASARKLAGVVAADHQVVEPTHLRSSRY
jgi:hypothetical protein